MTIGSIAMPTNMLSSCSNGMIYCFLDWTNDVTSGLFTSGLLLTFCIVLIMATHNFGMARAFGFASFVGLIGSVWLAIAGLMDWGIASMFIISGAIGMAVMLINER